jgi:hypothetical protein
MDMDELLEHGNVKGQRNGTARKHATHFFSSMAGQGILIEIASTPNACGQMSRPSNFGGSHAVEPSKADLAGLPTAPHDTRSTRFTLLL